MALDVLPANGVAKVTGHWRNTGRGQLLSITGRVGGRIVLEAQHAPGAFLLRPTGDATWDVVGDAGADAKVFYMLQLLGAELLQMMRPGKQDEVPAQFTRSSPPQPALGSLPPLRPPLTLSAAPAARSGRPEVSRSLSPGNRGGDNGANSEELSLRDQLIAKVKARQSASASVNQRWREYCSNEGRGIYDPRRHDARFLQGFLDVLDREAVHRDVRDGREADAGHFSDARSSPSRSGDKESAHGRARRSSRSRRRRQLGRARRRSPRKKERGRRRQGKERRRDKKRQEKKKHSSRKQRSPQASTASGSDESGSDSGDEAGSAASSEAPAAQAVPAAAAAAAAAAALSGGGASGGGGGGGKDQEAAKVDSELIAQRVAAEAQQAECERKLANANQEKIEAEKTLADERDHLTEEVEARVQGEKKRQQLNMARRIEEAEHAARLEEEERIREAVRQAAEEREAKVRSARSAAEEEMRQAILTMERTAHTEMSSRLRVAEERMEKAADRVKRAIEALEDATVKASKAKSRQLVAQYTGAQSGIALQVDQFGRASGDQKRGASVSSASQDGNSKRRRDESASSGASASSSSSEDEGGRSRRGGAGRHKARKKA